VAEAQLALELLVRRFAHPARLEDGGRKGAHGRPGRQVAEAGPALARWAPLAPQPVRFSSQHRPQRPIVPRRAGNEVPQRVRARPAKPGRHGLQAFALARPKQPTHVKRRPRPPRFAAHPVQKRRQPSRSRKPSPTSASAPSNPVRQNMAAGLSARKCPGSARIKRVDVRDMERSWVGEQIVAADGANGDSRSASARTRPTRSRRLVR
jgi:hypothetical protein